MWVGVGNQCIYPNVFFINSNLFLVCLFPFFVSFWGFFLAFREERKGGREERGKIYKRRKGDLDKKQT